MLKQRSIGFSGAKSRIHCGRSLLAQLRNLLYEAGRGDLAGIVEDLVSSYRRGLELLEESYIEGRYGEVSYLESQGRTCVEVSRQVLEVLEKIESELAPRSD